MRSHPFEFFESQTFQSVKVPFIWSSTNDLNHLSERPNNVPGQRGRELDVHLQAIEVIVRKLHLHGNMHIAGALQFRNTNLPPNGHTRILQGDPRVRIPALPGAKV